MQNTFEALENLIASTEKAQAQIADGIQHLKKIVLNMDLALKQILLHMQRDTHLQVASVHNDETTPVSTNVIDISTFTTPTASTYESPTKSLYLPEQRI